MDKENMVRSRHVEREAGRFVLRVHVGPTNPAQDDARVQPIQRQGRTWERLNNRMKAQAAGRDEQECAFGFLGNVAHDPFDLYPLAEQLAGRHTRGGRNARFRDSGGAENADIRTIDEGREQTRHGRALHFYYLA